MFTLLCSLIPETKGRSLEEMDVIFGSVKAEKREADIRKQERGTSCSCILPHTAERSHSDGPRGERDQVGALAREQGMKSWPAVCLVRERRSVVCLHRSCLSWYLHCMNSDVDDPHLSSRVCLGSPRMYSSNELSFCNMLYFSAQVRGGGRAGDLAEKFKRRDRDQIAGCTGDRYCRSNLMYHEIRIRVSPERAEWQTSSRSSLTGSVALIWNDCESTCHLGKHH